MQVFYNKIENFKPLHQQHIVTIGNYDGIHLGHQRILKKITHLSKQTQLPNILITFEPQPCEYLARKLTPSSHFRLMTWREKINMLQSHGIDKVLILRFNNHLASLTPKEFIEKLLVTKLQIKYLVVGADFKFGNKNSGDIDLLFQYSKQYNFQLIPIPIYQSNDYRISSSLIRRLLEQDDLATSRRLLGHNITATARVSHGDKRGRTLSFPTANLFLRHKILPLTGVYAVKIYNITPQPLLGIANIGFRPTVNSGKRMLEVHIFDFNQNIYGKIIKVEFIHKLRNEQKFATFTLLQQQIAQDIKIAKEYFMQEKIT